MDSQAWNRHKADKDDQDRSRSRPRNPARESDPSVPRTPGALPEETRRYVKPLFPRDESPEGVYVVESKAREKTADQFAMDFVRDAPLNDMKASDRFIRKYPGVLRESDSEVQRNYLDRATQAWNPQSNTPAFTYLEKYSLIRLITGRPGQDVMDSLITGDQEMIRSFKEIFSRAKDHCEKKAKEGRAGNRHTPGVSTVDELSAGMANLEFQDQRFRTLAPRDWNYFRPGRVFAVKGYNEYTISDQTSQDPDDYSMERFRTTRGTEVIEKIRRMVVVRARDAFCIAVPINTYGGKGLKKVGFRPNNIKAHARIFMSGRLPVWLDGEPKTGKKDIKVHPVDDTQRLHPASRVCFERTHSIDYNSPIMKIGTVASESLEYVTAYWLEETERPSGPGPRRPRGDSDLEQRPRVGRHDDVPQDKNRRGTGLGRGGRR